MKKDTDEVFNETKASAINVTPHETPQTHTRPPEQKQVKVARVGGRVIRTMQ